MDNAPDAPKPISLHILEEITNGFSKQRKLGAGAYGDVYLGEHKDGEKIAVKVLKDLDLDDEQFEKEYHNLASLHHKNVVQLVGYCHETKREYVQHKGRYVLAEKTKRVLCFEYMHNGSLDNFIYDESNRHNWCTRYGIIKGICEGLEYLHEKLKPPMYHLDLKPANILLDENMSPKIADFGLSRLFIEEKTKKTKSDIGTPGYRPPEYINEGLISTDKFDIFSLGVVIIKIMTGRDGYFRIDEMSSQQFAELVHSDWMNRLQATSVHMHSVQVRKCIEVALSCVEADRRIRPSIGVIINNLNKTVSSMILEALRNGSGSSIDQTCPCISSETEMMDILKNKLISYPLRITDNSGRVHKARITSIGDSAGDTSTFQPVRPRIKIIDCTEGFGNVITIDAHSTEPWILVGHIYGNVSIWNHQKQTRVMAFHQIDGVRVDELFTVAAIFIEPLQCFVVGDSLGYIHVYSYVKVDKLDKFRAHAFEIGWQCIRTFEGHSGFVHQVKFNPQTAAGNTFASSSSDSTIKIWNIHSPSPVATLDCTSKDQRHLDYFIPSGDRQYLVAGTTVDGAWIWDLQTNTRIKQIEGLQRYGCNIAVVNSLPGRQILLTVSHDHTVAFCDSTTHRYENRVKLNLGQVQAFAYINMIRSLAIGYEKGIAIMEIN